MNNRLPVWLWATIAIVGVLVVGFLDWLTGIELNFFVFYFLPVAVSAWFIGLGFSVAIAVFSVLVWFGVDVILGRVYSHHFYAVWNTTIHLVSFLVIGWSVFKIRYAFDSEQKNAENLGRALSEIKALEAFLPICAVCKKIRNQQDVWQGFEVYIGQQTGTQFSHSYCPDCAKKVIEEAGLIGKKIEP